MEEQEQAIYTIEKVKLKNEQLTVDYTERYMDANYRNDVTKSSQQFVHPDLKYAMDLLKPHVAAICEFSEAKKIADMFRLTDEELNETLKSYVVTGYSKGGSDESAGVTIIAQKILNSGQIFNITAPFTKYRDETGDGYAYGEELEDVIRRCDYEVDAYLFEQKFGLKQETLDFDAPQESDITGEDTEKPKRGRKKKEKAQTQAFDPFA